MLPKHVVDHKGYYEMEKQEINNVNGWQNRQFANVFGFMPSHTVIDLPLFHYSAYTDL